MSNIWVRVGNRPARDSEAFPFCDADQPRAQKNHGQSLERLDDRGGLAWSEAVAILEDRDWHKMDAAEAETRARTLLSDRTTKISDRPPCDWDIDYSGDHQ